MTQQEKLEQIVQTALDKGWKFPFGTDYSIDQLRHNRKVLNEQSYSAYIRGFFFSRSFHKALWGHTAEQQPGLMDWAYYMRESVIADDPINYVWQELQQ